MTFKGRTTRIHPHTAIGFDAAGSITRELA